MVMIPVLILSRSLLAEGPGTSTSAALVFQKSEFNHASQKGKKEVGCGVFKYFHSPEKSQQ